jgi:hypothetical protein
MSRFARHPHRQRFPFGRDLRSTRILTTFGSVELGRGQATGPDQDGHAGYLGEQLAAEALSDFCEGAALGIG